MENSIPRLLSRAERHLAKTSPTPRLDAELLLGHELGTSRAALLTATPAVGGATVNRFRRTVQERSRGAPVAYLTHEKEFYGRSFFVDQRVLIPRPETELLVELTLQQVRSNNLQFIRAGRGQASLTVVDLGTGSGNIIISLAKELESRITSQALQFIGTDVSGKALKVAKLNARRHGVLERITFLHGSLLDPLLNVPSLEIRNSKLVIVCNLPYVADHSVNDLAPDIKYFEPSLALAGGPNGLKLYEQLFAQLHELIVKSQSLQVRCYVEHDPRQLAALQELVQEHFGCYGLSHPDLAGLPRVLEITPA